MNPGFAQQEMLFRVKYSPDKTYTSDMVNDIKMEMDFSSDTAITKKMLAQGIKMPMQLDMLQIMTYSTRTGALTADKRIPITTSYDKADITMNVAGKEMEQPDRLKGMMFKGHATESGKITIDSIVGSAPPELRKAMEKNLNSMQFPEKSMKPGDTFTQEMPMVIPVGGQSMNMLIKALYTLREIKNEQAFFDFTQDVKLDLSMQQGAAAATGRGAGKMIYNIPAHYITDSDSDMTMDMSMVVREMTMKIKARAISSLKARVL